MTTFAGGQVCAFSHNLATETSLCFAPSRESVFILLKLKGSDQSAILAANL
jgi:hypothetical protein